MASKAAPKRAYDRHSSAGDLNSAASAISEFEEVRLEEFLEGNSAGSGGDESEWAHGSGSDDNAAKPACLAADSVPRGIVPDSAARPKQDASQSAGGAAGADGFAFDALAPVAVAGDVSYKAFEELDQAAHKAVGLASAAAKDVSVKLLGGASEAKHSLSKLAGDVTSWWASLDLPKPAAAAVEAAPPQTREVHKSSRIQDMFGLGDTEELMESFPCSLLQTFGCRHNAFSQPRQVAIPGKLYITDKNACFAATAASDATSAKVPLADIKGILKKRPMTKGDPESLRMELAEGHWLVLQGFSQSGSGATSHLDEVLALIEHLTEGS
ncbi:hypothetical protein WJX72_008797 [[Myrmecia] bisecta]|uniref:GRAM domain-containing protein n=1 Tax=[Myrmecia] bisecta TaxID=41462 RepID=A0AAW1R8S7_9CHLO